MAIYLLFMFMPVLVYMVILYIYKKTINSSDRLKRIYLFICGMFLFLMLACRHYSVGSGDGVWYYNNWRYMSQISFENLFEVLREFDMEKGYLLCVWILSHIFKNPQYIFVFYGLLVAIAVCRFLYLNCDNVVLGLIMFNCLGLWGFMVQGIRQGIAMCICLLAIEFCIKRKLFQFGLIVVLAALFHASALAFLVLYFFGFLEMNVKSYLLVAVCTLVGMGLIEPIFQIINLVINDSYMLGNTERTRGGFITTVIYLIILIGAVIFYRKKNQNVRNIELFFFMTWCGFITFIMRYSVNSIVQRISYYFMFGEMIVLPAIIQRLVAKERMIIYTLATNLCIGIAIYKSTYTELIPYLFFWQG